MVMVQLLLGLILVVTGIFVYRKNKNLVGGLLIFIGGSLVVLGVIAILSFHP